MRISLTLILLCFYFLVRGQGHTIYGHIVDSATGEPISNSPVFVIGSGVMTFSNAYGFYAMKVKGGMDTICFMRSGIVVRDTVLNVSGDRRLDMQLPERIFHVLQEVFVLPTGNRMSLNMSKHEINLKDIKSTPSLGGEADVLKTIQLLPGVNVANEGAVNFNVRGGSFDQNLFLLDECPVFNPSHALGFFSAFNADALRSVTFYKGAIPAQFGGRLSSVVDMHMKEGSNTRNVEGSIGMLASKVMMEGPVDKRGESTFLVAGRYSYLGALVDGIGGLISKSFVPKNNINFYDFNAKLNWKVNDNNRLYLSTYIGQDWFYSYPLDESNKLRWGNATGAFRWNHRFSSNLFSNISIVFSNYNYSYNSLLDARRFTWKSNVKVAGIKGDYYWVPLKGNQFRFGFAGFGNFFSPGNIAQSDSLSIIRSFELQRKRSADISAYVSNELDIGSRLQLNVGLRANMFLNLGPGMVYLYDQGFAQAIDSVLYQRNEVISQNGSVEPRITANYNLNKTTTLKVSYTNAYQYLHLISNSSVGLPTDIWLPSDKYIRPQKSDLFAIGAARKGVFSFSLEAYFRKVDNVIDYRDNANLFLNNRIETQVLSGKSRSFGVEMFIEKRVGRLTGWLSYTLSKTELKVDGINKNEWYPARYDVRHNLSVVLGFRASGRWNFASTFKLTSGSRITVPVGDFSYLGGSFSYYSDRNGYTLPPHHRLDISATYQNKSRAKRIQKEWVFGVVNAYNRYNLFALYIKPDPIYIDQVKAYNFYLYGIVPYVALHFRL